MRHGAVSYDRPESVCTTAALAILLLHLDTEYASVICRATIAASSPTPISSEDFRLRKKWTPTKYSPGTTVLAPSWVSGNPQVSKASGHGSQDR